MKLFRDCFLSNITSTVLFNPFVTKAVYLIPSKDGYSLYII